jgi:hypothetical protein
MAVVSGARRPGGPAALLLAVVLAVLGTSVHLPGDGDRWAAAEPRHAGATVDASFVPVVAPVRPVGRSGHEPSPPDSHGSLNAGPIGMAPADVPPVVWMRLGDRHESGEPVLLAPHRSSLGDRAPPLRLSDQ